MPVELQAIGNVEAISTVTIKAQISGQLMRVHFKEGDFVKKGQLLFTIDRAPFEAALRQAEGTLAKDEAQSLNSKLDAERYQGLGKARRGFKATSGCRRRLPRTPWLPQSRLTKLPWRQQKSIWNIRRSIHRSTAAQEALA